MIMIRQETACWWEHEVLVLFDLINVGIILDKEYMQISTILHGVHVQLMRQFFPVSEAESWDTQMRRKGE